MRRALFVSAALACVVIAGPLVRADVKTTEKSTFKLEGFLGSMVSRMAGGANEAPATVAVKGNRMSRMSDTNGQIVDLAEEKIYMVDLKKKEYTVATFAQMREQMEKARAEMAKRQQEMTPEQKQAMQDLADAMEFDVDVKQSGQSKTIAGHEAKETVLTITMRGKGKTLDESGGMVLTDTIWLAPRVPALQELAEFNLKFVKAVYGGLFSGMDPQQMNAVSAMLPGFGTMMQRLAEESRKLQGTPLASTMVLENVKSQEQMAAAPKPGGGLGGMLARRIARGQTQQRTTTLTTTHETLTLASSASAEDVALPAGLKLKN
ncbi:MAG: hypothetical protein IT184_13825 [Acidobacteria bacterium]|nr:hypothetical protein [Acidobacteriota bacterium]